MMASGIIGAGIIAVVAVVGAVMETTEERGNLKRL
jgi:hypothetical protein